jgi:carbonic anhydrase/acetyltransferase-like protein (isoleucine patch superfamily)
MLRSYQGIAPRIHDSCYIDESVQIIGDIEIGECQFLLNLRSA